MMISSRIIKLLFIQVIMGVTGVTGLTSRTLAQHQGINSAQVIIKIQTIEFTGNTVFSDAELDKILAPYKGKVLSPDLLLQAQREIDNYYRSQGYISSGSVLTAQELTNGKIQIQIIEGILEDIQFKGLSKLNENYLKSRLPRIGEPLNKKNLVESLERLQNDPLIKKINGQIDQESLGKNILSLYVEENSPIVASLQFIDGYSPAVGRLGGIFTLSHRNFLGFGERVILSSTQTEGIDRIGGSVSIPFNKLDGRFIFAINNIDSQVTERIVEALGIETDYNSISFGIKQPVISTLTDELILGIGIELKDGETFVLNGDVSFPFTEGLKDGKTRITSLNFFQEYIKNGSSTLFTINSQFNVGIDVFDATRTEVGIDGIYWLWRGNIQYLIALEPKKDVILVTRVGLQFTPDKLHPFEQITVGGRNNVQGYRPNIGVADNGLWGVIEGQITLIRDEKWGTVAIIPSFGIGHIWNNDRETTGSNTFASVGIGIRYRLQDAIEIRADYAHPLIDLGGFGETDTEDNLSVSLLINPLKIF